MEKIHFASAQFTEAYNILCATLQSGAHKESLYPTLCKIPVSGKTEKHAHFEEEIFYAVSGKAILFLDEEKIHLLPGGLVRVPPRASHEILNTGEEEFHFLSVYSEDFRIGPVPSDILITTAPPTPNGPLHLGHMSGPYLAADILARHFRSHGSKVKVLSGTDDHQNYVAERALSLGKVEEHFHTEMSSRIREGFEKFKVRYHGFISPKKDRSYQKRILQFFIRAKESKLIEEELVSFPFCEKCDVHLVDALLSGECPQCQESSKGGCESCGHVYPPYEILNPRCSRCHLGASFRQEKVYIFNLHKYLPPILKELEQHQFPSKIKRMMDKISTSKLKVLVTYPRGKRDSAIAVSAEQSLHVWFEMAASYEDFSLHPHWVHCFGFDNAFYYTLYIPAILQALNAKARMPDRFITNDFLHLEGMKFSTSRAHAIWADEFTGEIDHLRLYLCLIRPVKDSTNYSTDRFESFSQELGEKLGRLRLRLKDIEQLQGEPENEFLIQGKRLKHEIDRLLLRPSPDLRQAARVLLNFLDAILDLEHHPGNERFMINSWAHSVYPFMPDEAEALRRIG